MEENQKAPQFEELLSGLEDVVNKLEKSDIPLEDALKLFENGVMLGRECQRKLDEAEKKVEILLKDNGVVTGKQDFEPEA